ncbi:MAG TPA: di-heme oxidoredictase family protein [Bacteroidia bacterium]|nr:di-heme oxidoredictase family protein [Bacteroidia bacterium]
MRKYFFIVSIIVIFIAVAQSCRKPELREEEDYNEWLSGGIQTVFDESAGAFSAMFPMLSGDKSQVHGLGDAQFEATFVSAPAPVRPGLGPVFNNVSCSSCHIADGRGRPPFSAAEQLSSMLIRVSIPGSNEYGGPNPVPGFGGQLQQRATFGTHSEADVQISYNESTYGFADGETYNLREPQYNLINVYIPLPGNFMLSPRVAPPVFGLGLLEAIDEANILKNADEQDANGDGISGKPNYVWDAVKQQTVLGRFGWKANNPNLLQQTAGAYSEDMGITSFIFPKESCDGQMQDDNRNDDVEISDSLLHAVAFYIRTLAVPARRNADDQQVLMGKKLFKQAQCSSCHIPMMKTKADVAFPEISNQAIFPYTDMLLHDMGNDLADNRPDFLATGNEWRTSPLWGIGLTNKINGHNNYLHDGRARSLMEAVMWHGGEAEQSKNAVKNFSKTERDALIKFLESL